MIDDENVLISFPVEFNVRGTPVSLQASGRSILAWKKRIRDESLSVVPDHCFASEDVMSVTIYDFPTDQPQGDVDNIVKPVLDSLKKRIFVDDQQVARVCVQRFLPDDLLLYDELPEILARAAMNEPPYVFIRVSDDPRGEAQ